MTSEEFQGLVEGEPIRNIGSGNVYIVRGVIFINGEVDHLDLVRYITAYNPSEWEKLPADIHDRTLQEHNHA